MNIAAAKTRPQRRIITSCPLEPRTNPCLILLASGVNLLAQREVANIDKKKLTVNLRVVTAAVSETNEGKGDGKQAGMGARKKKERMKEWGALSGHRNSTAANRRGAEGLFKAEPAKCKA